MSDRTQDLKNLRAVATACKNYVDETKEQILWQVGQYDITTQDDNTIAYQKVVPTGATRVKIKSIGGMSYKSENLLVLSDVAETTTNGVTYKVENGVIYLNGTATADAYPNFNLQNSLTLNGSYSSGFFVSGSVNNTRTLYLMPGGTWFMNTVTNRTNFSVENTTFTSIQLNISNGAVFTNTIIKPMLVSGSTAPTEFKQGFTGIRDSIVTSVKSYDSNNNLIDTYTIPDEVKALTGYGWGINDTCYNYIDFENKKFIQKVGRVDLGSLDYTYNTSNLTPMFQTPRLSNTITNNLNMLCPLYVAENAFWTIADNYFKFSFGNSNVNISNSNYTNATSFKEAMSGIYLYYELATPIETDISQYIDNNIIEVEEGGYLVFENQYQQAVPSNVTYRIEVAK